jgi:hypothetical protein
MIQILLIHNKFNWKEPITWLSYGIRVATCSKWNHIAIRIDDRVIEAKGDGVTISSYDDWFIHSNRIVKPMIPKEGIELNLLDVLTTEGINYGFLDLVQMLRRIKAIKWDGKDTINLVDKKGLICSDLASILLGLPKNYTPSDFEYMFPHLLDTGIEYTTSKI